MFTALSEGRRRNQFVHENAPEEQVRMLYRQFVEEKVPEEERQFVHEKCRGELCRMMYGSSNSVGRGWCFRCDR